MCCITWRHPSASAATKICNFLSVPRNLDAIQKRNPIRLCLARRISGSSGMFYIFFFTERAPHSSGPSKFIYEKKKSNSLPLLTWNNRNAVERIDGNWAVGGGRGDYTLPVASRADASRSGCRVLCLCGQKKRKTDWIPFSLIIEGNRILLERDEKRFQRDQQRHNGVPPPVPQRKKGRTRGVR